MKFPKKTFDGYGNYFERLGGTFYADYDNGSAWLFPANRQKDIEDIVRNIVTGTLPKPENLQAPAAVPITLTSSVPITPASSTTSQIHVGVIERPTETSTSKKKVEEQVAPSTVVQTLNMMSPITPIKSYTINSKVPTETLITQAQKAQAQYSVIKQDPGEIEERYKRRQAYYNILLANPTLKASGSYMQYADTLSRMKVNIEFDNVKYNDHEMKVLLSYLPN
jgi:hypothetical protein